MSHVSYIEVYTDISNRRKFKKYNRKLHGEIEVLHNKDATDIKLIKIIVIT